MVSNFLLVVHIGAKSSHQRGGCIHARTTRVEKASYLATPCCQKHSLMFNDDLVKARRCLRQIYPAADLASTRGLPRALQPKTVDNAYAASQEAWQDRQQLL